MPVVWHVDAEAGRIALHAAAAVGWLLVLSSTFLINHFDLFGLRQAWFHASGRGPDMDTPFVTRAFYRIVRHPLMLGFLVAFWAAPTMTVAHLVFALATTAYILIAIQLEERDLVAAFGDAASAWDRPSSGIVACSFAAKEGWAAVRAALARAAHALPRPPGDDPGAPARRQAGAAIALCRVRQGAEVIPRRRERHL